MNSREDVEVRCALNTGDDGVVFEGLLSTGLKGGVGVLWEGGVDIGGGVFLAISEQSGCTGEPRLSCRHIRDQNRGKLNIVEGADVGIDV